MFWTLLKKEIKLDRRRLGRISSTLFLAMMLVLLMSFTAGPQHPALRALAPGFIWFSLVIVSVLRLQDSMGVEVESGAYDALVLRGAGGFSFFLAKALWNAVMLSLIGFWLLLLTAVVLGVEANSPFPLLGTITLGAFAISAPGTLYAALTARGRGQDVLLPLLLFPLLVPCVLACVKLSLLFFSRDAMGEASTWMGLLLLFCAVYWPLCSVLFERVMRQ